MSMCKCPVCGSTIELRAFQGAASNGAEGSGDVGELLERIHDDELETEFEITFMRDLRARYAQYGTRTKVSDKQLNVLRKIAAK